MYSLNSIRPKLFSIKTAIFLISLSFLINIMLQSVSGILHAQVMEEWVARYHSFKTDKAVALTVDADGNVYVTGESEYSGFASDYATIKYDAHGNQLWATRYESNAKDNPRGIALDARGNVYVTGQAWGSGNYADFTTIKYDPNGNQLWIAYYGGAGNDDANGIAVDDAGNVYVTGSVALGSNDCATVKYDSAGNELWVRSFDGTAHQDDGGRAIAVDENGNVYVTGACMDTLTYYDFLTISYDSSGNLRWLFTFDSADSAEDVSYAIAVKNGRVAVCGKSYDLDSYFDYATVCFSTSGNVLWAQRYNGPGNGGDEPAAITMDEHGNVYVTGKSNGAGTMFDYATIKYAPDGTRLWVARYNGTANGTDEASGIALDNFGNVYVTGKSQTTGSGYDYVTIKYDSSGNQLWVQNYNGDANDYDEATAIFVDENANVYVTGGSWGGNSRNFDFATIKYAQATGIHDVPPLTANPTMPSVASITSVFRDRINIKFSKTMKRPLQVELFDVLGRQIFQNHYNYIPLQLSISNEQLSRLSSGTYLLELRSGSTQIAGKKLIKIR